MEKVGRSREVDIGVISRIGTLIMQTHRPGLPSFVLVVVNISCDESVHAYINWCKFQMSSQNLQANAVRRNSCHIAIFKIITFILKLNYKI